MMMLSSWNIAVLNRSRADPNHGPAALIHHNQFQIHDLQQTILIGLAFASERQSHDEQPGGMR